MNPATDSNKTRVRLPHEENSEWVYASLLWRSLAETIDVFVLLSLNALLALIVYSFLKESQLLPPISLRLIFGSLFVFCIHVLAMFWIYTACLESSAWQGSLGMKICGLIIVDERGARITFGRSSARYFLGAFGSEPGIINTALILLTRHKQDLEDCITETYVLRRRAGPFA